MNNRIKLFLLTGFLGAGKTTFLQTVLASRRTEKVGLIINEFGKIGIDGVLLQHHGMDILELNNGSVFCSCLKKSFIDGLIAYASLPIDFLIVESSGMSDPSGIQQILESVVQKRAVREYEYCGTICLVDAAKILAQAEVLNVIERQIKISNVVIINKSDLASKEQIQSVTNYVREINEQAHIYTATQAQADIDILRDDFLCQNPTEQSTVVQESLITADNRPKTLTLTSEELFALPVWESFLLSLTLYAFRIKGFIVNDDGVFQVDAVAEQLNIKCSCIERSSSQLVIISKKGVSIIRDVFTAWEIFMSGKMILK